MPVQGDETSVTIFMENTGQIAVARVQTPGGRVTYDGVAAIDGVPGTADDDCEDNNVFNFPGNTEVCDAQDNNCDTVIDEGLTFDDDGDGATSIGSCTGSADPCGKPGLL